MNAPDPRSLVRASLLAVGLLVPRLAFAVDPSGAGESDSSPSEIKTLTDYLADLSGDDAPQRIYAARTVRFETRRALHAIDHAPPDSLAVLDAQSTLVEIEARAPGACQSALHFKNTAMICAEIVADLGRKDLLSEVKAARMLVTDKCQLKRFDKAVAALEAAPEAAKP